MTLVYIPGQSAAQADSALRNALHTEEKARKCAVLWFAEILDRRLFREPGYSSMPQYARQVLGFSETRTGDFMRLARKLEKLPAVKAALPEIGYTKAREIIKVASTRTEGRWVTAAKKHGRRDLARQVKRVMNKARQPAASLFDQSPPDPAPSVVEEVPVRVGLEFTPEQFARWEALLEKLRRQGLTGYRVDILLDALAGKLEETTSTQSTTSAKTAPRGAVPPVQIHVHQCPKCGQTETGDRPLGNADRERIECDAAISVPGHRNTTTIPPRVRRKVLARDRHRCRAPGCGRKRFLEVHHLLPRKKGGTNNPSNLMTLCSACHRLLHERGTTPTVSMG